MTFCKLILQIYISGTALYMLSLDRSKPGWPTCAWNCTHVQDRSCQVWINCPLLDPEVRNGLSTKTIHKPFFAVSPLINKAFIERKILWGLGFYMRSVSNLCQMLVCRFIYLLLYSMLELWIVVWICVNWKAVWLMLVCYGCYLFLLVPKSLREQIFALVDPIKAWI